MASVVFSLALISSVGSAIKFAGPFDVIIKEPVICEDTGTKEIFVYETLIRKTSRTGFHLSLKLHLGVPYSDDIQINVCMSVWGNGGWRPNYLIMEGPACSFFKQHCPAYFAGIVRRTNMTHHDCPIPQGDYSFDNFSALPNITIPQLPYNKYKIMLKHFKDSVLVGCVGLIADVVPKLKKRRDR